MFGVCTYSEFCKVNVAAESKKSFFFNLPRVLGTTQEDFSQEKDISCETRLHPVESEDSADQQDQPASPVTSSSFEHHTGESRHTSDGKDLPCDFLVPSTSSSTDSSTEGDTDDSDRAKTAEEPMDKM